MDLSTAADIAQVLSLLTVVVGGGFALLQMRNARQQREDQAAYAFLQYWEGDIVEDLDLVYGLPDAASPDLIDGDPALRRAAGREYMIAERLGILVHDRQVSLALADTWAGGTVRVAWRKLRPWIERKRKVSGTDTPGEWFQWLAERLQERDGDGRREGAHTTFRSWKP